MDNTNAPDESDPTTANSNVTSEENIQVSSDAAAELEESQTQGTRHMFWETQPVVQFNYFRGTLLPEGPIEPRIPVSEVKQDPYNLPAPYEWISCDIDSEEVYAEVHILLTQHYCESELIRTGLVFSKEFLRWTLHPPGYRQSWLIGVRAKTSKKVVGFIAAVPAKIRVGNANILMAKVMFLCVHKKLRSKRLTPVMIKELTRRVHLDDIWQAVYSEGLFLPTPLSICRCWHRPLNPKKLVASGFVRVGNVKTISMATKFYWVPDQTVTPGFRKMNADDIPAVVQLLRDYMKRFFVASGFTKNDVNHWLLPKPDVVDTYLVECPATHRITDLCSFYILPTSMHSSTDRQQFLKVAYSYYNVSTRTPFVQLMRDALVVAKQMGIDVFSALDVMRNEGFLRALKFIPGDGNVYYHLYNYRVNQMVNPSEIGVVLL